MKEQWTSKKIIITIISVLIMLAGFVIPPFGGITQVGVTVIFIFVGVLIVWSFGGSDWASLLALVLFALSGFYGEGAAGVKDAFIAALGNDTILTIIFLSILFGGLQMSGAIAYLARWFLSRKIVAGHPYVIIAFIGITSFIVCGVSTHVVSLIVMWGIVSNICKISGIERSDSVWKHLFGVVFIASSIGVPFLPFQGVGVAMMTVYRNVAEAFPITNIGYIVFCLIMFVIMMALYLLLVRFVFRPDMSKLKNTTAEEMYSSSNLPPMSKAQKIYLAVLPIYLILVIVPSLGQLGVLPVLSLLARMGALGIAFALMVLLILIHVEGKPILNFREVAAKQVPWSLVLMVAVCVAISGAFGKPETGIMAAIQSLLRPVLAGKPTIIVVLIILLTGTVITNFAANAAMASVLTPIAVACCNELGINPAPVALCIMMVVFVALMFPSGSPGAAMCYGEDKYYSAKEIRSYAWIMSSAAVLIYTFIGYPLANVLVNL